jgi:Ca-activated chloride channel family protein
MTRWLESLTGLTFLDPWLLLLFLCLPAALWLRRWLGQPAVAFAPGSFTHGLPGSWRVRLSWLPRTQQLLGLLAVVLAVGRPVHRDRLPLKTEGIDILMCLDLSSSMSATDMDKNGRRNRLDVAKEAAARFVDGRPDDRIGLICFARYPDVRCPMTLDHGALKKFLAETRMVEPRGPEDATGIGTAVARAAQALKTSVAKSKVVILLTDGQETVATPDAPDEITPTAASKLCKELGIRVYTIAVGIGDRGPFGGIQPIDHRDVKRLAEKTGGEFYEARDVDALRSVYAEINDMEKIELREPRYKVEERFLVFLGAALVLLLLARVLHSTVFEVLP